LDDNISGNKILFLPQQPYLVLGSFREQIIYPDKISKLNDNDLLNILKKVNLGYIFERIGSNWNLIKEW
jgi:ABC-type uncharacterized transport system fused permease/ATPase subunit